MIAIVEIIKVCLTHILYDGSAIPAEYNWGTHCAKKAKYEL
jgi:hypothetical protein